MNVAIIGTGKIVHEALPVMAATDGIMVRSIWCREHSLAKAQALAERFGIPVVTTDYAAVLADAQVDTVYVALVNSVHYAYALQALQAGKNVILEKPACMRHRELARLAEEARSRGLMLFEAVTLLHLPAFHLLQTELLPQLGTLRHVECNYSQRSSRFDAYLRGEVLPAFDPVAGGGAMMDINIYNLHFTLALLGLPLAAHYFARRGFNGVDLSGSAVLEYVGLTALCTGAKDTDAPSFGLLQGDDGWLRIDGPVSTISSMTLSLRGQPSRQIPLPPVVHRLAPEFEAFADLLRREDFMAMNRLLDHSLTVMQLMDELSTPKSPRPVACPHQ
ncbi:MAG: Gfo/Idh/MocA family oxidoreductase [Bacteroidaceae bacterium]|nr:Gfo/Idh/MocA family oxidoreductase [Bacteroidaceae bacterium]